MIERRQLVVFAVLSLTLVLLATNGVYAQQCTAHGDVNCTGGDPTIGDLLWIIEFFDGSQILPPCPVQMDVNGDCVVDHLDYQLLLGCILISHIPCPEVSTCCNPVYNYSCCVDRVGDVNGYGWEEPTIGDVSAIIDMLFISGAEVGCVSEADMNQSGGANPGPGDIKIGDISILIDHLFITGSSLELAECLVWQGGSPFHGGVQRD